MSIFSASSQQFWQELTLARFGRIFACLSKVYALVAAVMGYPVVKRVKSVGATRVGVALHVDDQLKVGGHF